MNKNKIIPNFNKDTCFAIDENKNIFNLDEKGIELDICKDGIIIDWGKIDEIFHIYDI